MLDLNDGGDDGGDSCKTNRKPYDLVVCAILIRAKQLAKNGISVR